MGIWKIIKILFYWYIEFNYLYYFYFFFFTDDEYRFYYNFFKEQYYPYNIKNFFYHHLIVHFFFQLLDSTFRRVFRASKSQILYDTLNRCITSVPKITLQCKCFHYKSLQEVITYESNKEFRYYSIRDISGILNVESSKPFIYLKLKTDIDLSEKEVIESINTKKNYIEEENRMRDQQIRINVETQIPFSFDESLLRIDDTNPWFFGILWYLIMSLLPITQLYKIYINSLFTTKTFTIKKVVSNITNLRNISQYNSLNPQLVIDNKPYYFEPFYFVFNENKESGNIEQIVNRVDNTINERRQPQYINNSQNLPDQSYTFTGDQTYLTRDDNLNPLYHQVPTYNMMEHPYRSNTIDNSSLLPGIQSGQYQYGKQSNNQFLSPLREKPELNQAQTFNGIEKGIYRSPYRKLNENE